NDLYVDTPTYSFQGRMDYALNDSWTSQTVLSRSSTRAEGHYSYLYEITTTVEELTGTMMEDGIIFARYTNRQDSQSLGTDIQQNFIGDFSLGSMRNRMVIGLDYYNSRSIDNGSGYGNQGFVYIGGNVEEFQAVAPALH